jgi:hypothetical protein
MLTEIQKLALEKLSVKADRTQITSGTHTVQPFTIEVRGALTVSADETYTPTVDIPLIPTVALALKKMGVQRAHFLKVMREAVNEVVLADRNMRSALIAQSGLEEFEAEFRQKVLAELPNKTRNGKVSSALTVTPVTTGLIR